ncbi:3-carboxy-cis,cis-muconate cycloisomerase, partial [Streptomyces sp. NPDC002078]
GGGGRGGGRRPGGAPPPPAAELAEGLRVHPAAMRRNLGLTRGLIVSERLSAALSPVLGRARAKELLTELARRAHTEDRPLHELLAEQAELKDIDLDDLCAPAHYTGFAGTLTDRALERR